MTNLVAKARFGREKALVELADRKEASTTTLILRNCWIVPQAASKIVRFPVSFMQTREKRTHIA